MFSSVGQIVGLIEIEPADGRAQLLASQELEDSFDGDASLEALLARLSGRLPSQTPETGPGQPIRPTNRLATPITRSLMCGADLVRLEADLADETGRFRLQLASAGGRALGR